MTSSLLLAPQSTTERRLGHDRRIADVATDRRVVGGRRWSFVAVAGAPETILDIAPAETTPDGAAYTARVDRIAWHGTNIICHPFG